jgi:FSR family fosmidomycin resistance protein-like MFS transporter
MLNALRDFLALYFVDVVGTSEATAAFSVLLWTVIGLPGDLLLIPLLERVRGLSYLRVSVGVCLVALPLFLLAQGLTTKFVLLGVLGFANAGWYSILQARLYSEMHGRSGTVMALANIAGLLNALTPLALGAFAQRFGLGAMMWLLVAGPAALLFGLLTTKPDAESAATSSTLPQADG